MAEVRKKRRLKRKTEEVPLHERARIVSVGEGVPNLTTLREELQDMTDVLLGRKAVPVKGLGLLTLMELADAYFARGMEMQMLLHKAEARGNVLRGSEHYKFRTGELRDFIDLAKGASDLGSRRITAEQLQFEQETRGRESHG